MFAEPGAAAITTLYARDGILDEWSWSCFRNAYYIIMDGLGYMPQSEAQFRVQQLMCRIPSRATVIKAYEDYHGSPRAYISGVHIRATQSAPDIRFHTSYSTATGSSNSSRSTPSSKSSSRTGPGLQFLDCDVALSPSQVDNLCQAGPKLLSMKLRVSRECSWKS